MDRYNRIFDIVFRDGGLVKTAMMPPVKPRGGIITAQHSTKSGIRPNAGAGVGEITCDNLMPDRFQG
ncbi:hypothetical protein COO92_08565 [Thalassospira lohafexi]|uniref:Uncharacterized protein n=1 Tax=Thalassospira lohafexi TaxID=744227 RepID=A0A2N3L859_9PROT|nr:hypothetical protein COO92_08565 [Thalassospira lohafexi]